MTNQDRSERCRKRILGYSGKGEPELTCLTDLLADAFHAFGADAVQDAFRIARYHHSAERSRPCDTSSS